MSGTIKAELKILNATGGSAGIPGGGSGGGSSKNSGWEKSLNDIARYVNRPSQIFSSGGAGILSSIFGAGSAGIVAAAAPVAAAIAISAAAIVIPHQILKAEFDRMDNAIDNMIAARNKVQPNLDQYHKDQQSWNNSTTNGENTAAGKIDGEKALVDLMKEKVDSQTTWNRLNEQEERNMARILEINKSLADNSNMEYDTFQKLREERNALLDTDNEIDHIRANMLKTGDEAIGQVNQEVNGANALAAAYADAAKQKAKLASIRDSIGGKDPRSNNFNFSVNGMDGVFNGRVESIGGKDVAVGIRTKA